MLGNGLSISKNIDINLFFRIISLLVSIFAVFVSSPSFFANNDSSGASIDLKTFDGYASSPFPILQYREKSADSKSELPLNNQNRS
jgi:hypothetical protein